METKHFRKINANALHTIHWKHLKILILEKWLSLSEKTLMETQLQ